MMPGGKNVWSIGKGDVKLIVCASVYILLIFFFLQEHPQTQQAQGLLAIYDNHVAQPIPQPESLTAHYEPPFDFQAAISVLDHLTITPREWIQVGADLVAPTEVLEGLVWIAFKRDRADLVEKLAWSHQNLRSANSLFMEAAVWSCQDGNHLQAEKFLARIGSPTYRAQALAAVSNAAREVGSFKQAQELCRRAYATLQQPDPAAEIRHRALSSLAVFALAHKLRNDEILIPAGNQLVTLIESEMTRLPKAGLPLLAGQVSLIYRILGNHQQLALQQRLERLSTAVDSPESSQIHYLFLLEQLKVCHNIDVARSLLSEKHPDTYRFRAGIIVLQKPEFVSMHSSVQEELCKIIDRLPQDSMLETFSKLLTSPGLIDADHAFRKKAFEHLAAIARNRKDPIDRQGDLRWVALGSAPFHPQLAYDSLREGVSLFDGSRKSTTAQSKKSERENGPNQLLQMPLFNNAGLDLYINANLRLGRLSEAERILSEIQPRKDRGVSRLQLLQFAWAQRQREKVAANLAPFPGEGLADFQIVEALLVTSLRMKDWQRAEILCGLYKQATDTRQNLYAFYLGTRSGQELKPHDGLAKFPGFSENSKRMFMIGKTSSPYMEKHLLSRYPINFVSGDDEFDILMRDIPDDYR